MLLLSTMGVAAATDTEKHWAKNFIQHVESEGLLIGVATNKFAPDTNVTRAMMITVLHRLAGEPAAESLIFKDINNTWYGEAVYWGYENNIIQGDGQNYYPNRSITREEACVMLANYMEYAGLSEETGSTLSTYGDKATISNWAQEAVTLVTANGIMSGDGDGNFDPQTNLTRAECAVVLCRLLGQEFENYSPPPDPPKEETGTLIATFKSTFYCPGRCCNGGWAGQTATGVRPTAGRTIAVDPSIIPLGSKVRLEFTEARLQQYNGIYYAEDTGGAIKGYRVDVLLSSHSATSSAGVGQVRIYRL